jgi:hypothetical protein
VRKEFGVAVAAIALVVLVGGTAIFLFSGRAPGSFVNTRAGPFYPTYPTSLTCGVENGSCRIVIADGGTVDAKAVGCEFQSIYAVNGNNQTITTVDRGAGVLSNEPGGPATSITIPAGTSVPVYCTVTTPSSYVETGSQADGEILFANQSLNVQFLGIWQ